LTRPLEFVGKTPCQTWIWASPETLGLFYKEIVDRMPRLRTYFEQSFKPISSEIWTLGLIFVHLFGSLDHIGGVIC
jgi:hypothetical protein